MAGPHTGGCFCGAVQFEVSGDPMTMGYCHCGDCTTWAAAPINSFSLWPRDAVKVTKGEDLIGTYTKTESAYRKFCKTCGGHLFSDHPNQNFIDVYPNVVPDLKHEPAVHVYYGEKTVSVKDGLPKFKDMPADFGGSGETLPD